MKKWYKSKTVLFGILTVLGAVCSAVINDKVGATEAILVAVGALNVYLRSVTTESISK